MKLCRSRSSTRFSAGTQPGPAGVVTSIQVVSSAIVSPPRWSSPPGRWQEHVDDVAVGTGGLAGDEVVFTSEEDGGSRPASGCGEQERGVGDPTQPEHDQKGECQQRQRKLERVGRSARRLRRSGDTGRRPSGGPVEDLAGHVRLGCLDDEPVDA